MLAIDTDPDDASLLGNRPYADKKYHGIRLSLVQTHRVPAGMHRSQFGCGAPETLPHKRLPSLLYNY